MAFLVWQRHTVISHLSFQKGADGTIKFCWVETGRLLQMKNWADKIHLSASNPHFCSR